MARILYTTYVTCSCLEVVQVVQPGELTGGESMVFVGFARVTVSETNVPRADSFDVGSAHGLCETANTRPDCIIRLACISDGFAGSKAELCAETILELSRGL
jgi:hypothetical protein